MENEVLEERRDIQGSRHGDLPMCGTGKKKRVVYLSMRQMRTMAHYWKPAVKQVREFFIETAFYVLAWIVLGVIWASEKILNHETAEEE